MAASSAIERVRIADVAAGVAAMERVLIRMLEVKVRRDGDKAVAGETLRQIAGVADEAVALVHDDHGGSLRGAIRHGNEGRHAAAAVGVRRPHAGHCFDASARKLASMKPSSGGGCGEVAHRDQRVEIGLDAVLEQRGIARDHLLLDIEVVGGGRDLRRGLGVLGEDGDDLVAVGGVVDNISSP